MVTAERIPSDITSSEIELLNMAEMSDITEKGRQEDTVPFLSRKQKGYGSLRKEMNLVDIVAYVVGAIIGSGIFITPAIIFEKTGSFAVSMICWFVGMIIATVALIKKFPLRFSTTLEVRLK